MDTPKVLVLCASRAGSTAEIAEAVTDTLVAEGLDAERRAFAEARDLAPYRAVVVGSAVYTMGWRKEAVAFLRRHVDELAGRDVWLFQSGPLDRSPEGSVMALPKRVAALADRIGIRGYATFGGKLDEQAAGFIAHAMVKRGAAGDFRDFDRIRAWARDVAREISSAPA